MVTTRHNCLEQNAWSPFYNPQDKYRILPTGRGTPVSKPPGKMISEDAIRVLIVDDHALFRRGLQMVLEGEADIDVVGEASDGHEAIERAEATTPDVVLMDVRMPKRSGIEATRTIKDTLPSTKILMLTISDEEADLYDRSEEHT